MTIEPETMEASAARTPERVPDVSVAIVGWNSAPWIGRCLASLPAAAGSSTIEVFFFDNASPDDGVAVARRAGDVEVIASAVNRGFGGAFNDLLPRMRGRYVFLLNPDSAPEPRSIETLVAYLDGEGIAGAVPLLIGEDGTPQREFQLRRLPTVRSMLAETLLLDELRPGNRVSERHRYRALDITRPQPIEQPAAAALMLRRTVVDVIGPMDERFHPAWFEDVDYCRRLRQAGERIDLVPAARVLHSGGASLDALGWAPFLEIWYRNLYRYAVKWLRPGQAELVRWSVICGMILRMAATATGLHRPPGGRRQALQAWKTVLGQAMRRWDATSTSS